MTNTITTIRELAQRLYGENYAITSKYAFEIRETNSHQKFYSLNNIDFFTCKALVEKLKKVCALTGR